MAAVTRLGAIGVPRPPYGSFAGKAEFTVVFGVLCGSISVYPAIAGTQTVQAAVAGSPSVIACEDD